MKLMDNSSRLGIFIFYDKDNIIDDYVIYMLDSLTEAVNELIIVSNSKSVLSMINNSTNIETIICVISIISILSIGFVVLFTKSSKEE